MPSPSCTNCYKIRQKKLAKYSLTVYMCFALCLLKACLLLRCFGTYVSESLLITFWVVCFIMMPQLFCRSESCPTVCICTRDVFSVYDHKFLDVSSTCFLWKRLITSRVFTPNVCRNAMCLVFMTVYCSFFILSMVAKFTMDINNF